MRYNSDMNRYKGDDPRLLGQLLSSDRPINCLSESAEGNSYTCKNTRSYNRYTRANNSTNGCFNGCMNECSDNNNHMDDAMLASACNGNPSLAMVYPPYQHFHALYSTNEALSRGTMFRELYKPWKAGGIR